MTLLDFNSATQHQKGRRIVRFFSDNKQSRMIFSDRSGQRTFSSSGDGKVVYQSSARAVPLPPKPCQRAVSLPDKIGRIENSTKRLFWFIPLRRPIPRNDGSNIDDKTTNASIDDEDSHLVANQTSDDVAVQWATMTSLERSDSDDATKFTEDDLADDIDEELLGLEFLDSCRSIDSVSLTNASP